MLGQKRLPRSILEMMQDWIFLFLDSSLEVLGLEIILQETVTLDVTTYRGVSWNAVHYYGNIIIDGVSFSPEDSPNTYTMCTETYEAEEKNPLAAGFYRIELVRPVTSEEIEKDSSRWNGYKVGDKTNAFYSPEDVIAIAKEVCKARFLGNWKLKIVDYSGKDLDSEILISEL